MFCALMSPNEPGANSADGRSIQDMPKRPNTQQVRLVSTEDTGYFYVTFKNPKNTTEKLEKKKYDPVARKHVLFKEAKIK